LRQASSQPFRFETLHHEYPFDAQHSLCSLRPKIWEALLFLDHHRPSKSSPPNHSKIPGTAFATLHQEACLRRLHSLYRCEGTRTAAGHHPFGTKSLQKMANKQLTIDPTIKQFVALVSFDTMGNRLRAFFLLVIIVPFLSIKSYDVKSDPSVQVSERRLFPHA
jgi:hypothetical protein